MSHGRQFRNRLTLRFVGQDRRTIHFYKNCVDSDILPDIILFLTLCRMGPFKVGSAVFTAWLTQASGRAYPGRDKTVTVTSWKRAKVHKNTRAQVYLFSAFELTACAHTTGALVVTRWCNGNTWAFGAHILGSSPSRVV